MSSNDTRFGTVLIVDDDRNLLASFASHVGRRTGSLALTATTSSSAMELANKHRPELAIVDLQLGSESGIELIRELKREHPAITAVLISGYSSVQSTVLAMRAGADDVLVKPITWAEIMQRLEPDGGGEPPPQTPTLARAQWEHIHRVLADCDGNISLAARKLGMYRSTLQRWLRRHAPA